MDYELHERRTRRRRIGKAADFAAMAPKTSVRDHLASSEAADPLKARNQRRKLKHQPST